MSERDLPMDEEKSTVLERPSPDTAGSMLRAAREKAGIHIAALAVAIKIPVKKLEALEADQLLGAHDLVFTRALASSVCRTLKIDATPILAALPQAVVCELHVDDNGINAPFTTRVAGQSRPVGEVITQPWMMLVIALCVGVVAIITTGLWGHKDSLDTASVSSSIVAEEVAVPQTMAPVVIPAQGEVDAKPDAMVSGTEPSSQPAVVASASAVTVASAPAKPVAPPVAPPSQMVVNPAESKPSTVASGQLIPVADAVISFKARQQSVWVQVVDAKGEVRLRRNIAAGERVECGGVLPLQVILGRADSVDVAVRGKSFDFSPFARDNVARFEVK